MPRRGPTHAALIGAMQDEIHSLRHALRLAEDEAFALARRLYRVREVRRILPNGIEEQMTITRIEHTPDGAILWTT